MVANLPPTKPETPAIVVIQNITQSQPSQNTALTNISNRQSSPINTPKPTPEPTTHDTTNTTQHPVSAHNPCPFLRMLVAQGQLPDGKASLSQVNEAIQRINAVADTPRQPISPLAIKTIGATANGLNPVQIGSNIQHGVQLDNLRYHIFDKEGSGSRILDEQANFVPAELERLASFGSAKLDPNGNSEIGLNEQEIKAMMNANYARAKGHRRAIDRPLMNGEFPVLLKVIGKQGKNERYLSVADVERLFKERRLPERMEQRL